MANQEVVVLKFQVNVVFLLPSLSYFYIFSYVALLRQNISLVASFYVGKHPPNPCFRGHDDCVIGYSFASICGENIIFIILEIQYQKMNLIKQYFSEQGSRISPFLITHTILSLSF